MVANSPDLAWVAAAVAATAAGIERWRASKVTAKTAQEKEVVADAKAQEARGNLYAKMSEEYKGLLEKEYIAHQVTRDYHHTKANEFQAELCKCNERCTELQSKTDITKIELILIEQGKRMIEMIEEKKSQGKALLVLTESIRELLAASKSK